MGVVVLVGVLVFRLILVLVLSEFMTLGVPAYAVGCLSAPLRSGLRQKAAEGFPTAPLTQQQQQQQQQKPRPGRGKQCQSAPQTTGERFGDLLLRELTQKAMTKTRVGEGQNAPDKARERFGDVLLM